MTSKFAVFILSHGRPDNVKTYRTLRNQGYTGDIYLIVDDEDDTAAQYQANFGEENVIISSKSEVDVDIGGFFGNRKTVVYARNACFSIASDLGLDYFLQLDDDYSRFDYRFDNQKYYSQKKILNLDSVFAAVLKYLHTIPAMTITLGQNGDYFGGEHGSKVSAIKTGRKAINTFFCATQQPFQFYGALNDDVNTYVLHGYRGNLFLTLFGASVEQADTQKQDGGLTDIYLEFGTYVKSFYTIMYAPSCVNITLVGTTHKRIHHQVHWNNTCPKIIQEDYRRA